eukprot:2966374-Pyramimonas_sp.AAC.1
MASPMDSDGFLLISITHSLAFACLLLRVCSRLLAPGCFCLLALDRWLLLACYACLLPLA